MTRNHLTNAVLLGLTVIIGAVALDAAAIVTRPLWPWVAWMLP